MRKTIFSSNDEGDLIETLWSPALADDLESFVLYVFPWGEPNTPLEHHNGPRRWQRRVLRRISDHIRVNQGKIDMDAMRAAAAAGRGIGKSALVSWLILWMLTTRIGSSVVVSANSENQLRTVTWGELTKWTTMIINAHWWEVSATKLVPAKWLTDLVERDFKKGTRYWAAEGKLWSEENPDSYAGVHNHDGVMVIFDEASGIPDGIWSVAAGFFTEKILDRYWLAFSNPRRNSGYFFECFNSKRDYWQNDVIDARTVEGTDKAVYQQIIDEYGEDSREARVEVFGLFPISEDGSFISPHFVDEAFKRKLYKDPSAPITMGIDPARSGTDSTVIVVRQGRDVVAIERHHGDDTMESVGKIIDAMERYKPTLTCIDEGGIGAGILDRLTEQRYKVRGVNFAWKAKNPKAHLNKRAEIWCAMREWLKTAAVVTDRRFKDDLTGVRSMFASSGAIQLESKKDMRARGLASPDSADALAVTFAYPVAHRQPHVDKTPVQVQSYNSASSNWMAH